MELILFFIFLKEKAVSKKNETALKNFSKNTPVFRPMNFQN
jgi:hypothetical protein